MRVDAAASLSHEESKGRRGQPMSVNAQGDRGVVMTHEAPQAPTIAAELGSSESSRRTVHSGVPSTPHKFADGEIAAKAKPMCPYNAGWRGSSERAERERRRQYRAKAILPTKQPSSDYATRLTRPVLSPKLSSGTPSLFRMASCRFVSGVSFSTCM
jgi:hypothetical protein